MKTSMVFLLILIFCYLCRAQEHSHDNDILLQGVENKAEEGVQELERQTDMLAELIALREMVVEQSVELRHLTARVTAAENLVEKLQMENSAMEARMTTTENLMERLQMENSAMEARMTAAESMAEELQMENDAQATELAVSQEKLSSLQQRVTVSENHVAELERQQEVRKLAFSVSLLESGEGNTEKEDVQLIYRKIFTNVGNHYNPNTGYFTAPVKGIYYFRFTGHIAHSDASMRMGLFKNSDRIVTSGDRATTSTDPEDNASNGVVVQLEVGDVVSVQLFGKIWDDQYHRSTFSGFLLFAL
ncbi:centrosomal protein of 120 kDa isoform X1 [Larimichthys crocea]|uniref:centrosomal protein of 120 kDa isoform X1 n=1 Tax=Larimichthys crocea TaxID=215358 RepID=UPI00090157B7|nr:centrosomal protein of 120 kDa isoform X1 [Larimichthys crocea]